MTQGLSDNLALRIGLAARSLPETSPGRLMAVLTDKTVALFGLGDQVGYPDEFVDALGIFYRKLKKLGAAPIGSWPVDDYEFEKSKAVINEEFVGLVIDQDNQSDMTAERVKEWVDMVKPELLAVAEAA